jgi:hypothetical protein
MQHTSQGSLRFPMRKAGANTRGRGCSPEPRRPISAHICYSMNVQALCVEIASNTADALLRGRRLPHCSRQTRPACEKSKPQK